MDRFALLMGAVDTAATSPASAAASIAAGMYPKLPRPVSALTTPGVSRSGAINCKSSTAGRIESRQSASQPFRLRTNDSRRQRQPGVMGTALQHMRVAKHDGQTDRFNRRFDERPADQSPGQPRRDPPSLRQFQVVTSVMPATTLVIGSRPAAE